MRSSQKAPDQIAFKPHTPGSIPVIVSGDRIVAAEPPAAAIHRSDPEIAPAVRIECADVSGGGHAAADLAVAVDLAEPAFGRCGQQGARP